MLGSIWSKQDFGQKFSDNKIWVERNLKSKKTLVIKIWSPKICGSKNVSEKNLRSTNFWAKKILVPKNYGCQKIGSKNFGQNRVSNSWDIPDMGKYRQGKCCLDKCHSDSRNWFKMVPRTYLYSLVKIGPVTTEILLIWTNVAWTNVTMTVDIC